MNELLKAIEELKRAYKASGVDMVTVEINLDETRIRIDGENFETPKQKPITNGEWLRGLSDEELAKHISCVFLPNFDKYVRGHLYCMLKGHNCYSCKLDWLRAEHKED